MSDKTDLYFQDLATRMNNLPISLEKHNIIFTDGRGGYMVRSHSLEDNTFDSMIDALELFNAADGDNNGVRAIMIKSPNQYLRMFHEDDGIKSMITFCASMKDTIRENANFTVKGAIDEDYLVPDGSGIKYIAAIVKNTEDLFTRALRALGKKHDNPEVPI